jgi:protein SCO1/2
VTASTTAGAKLGLLMLLVGMLALTACQRQGTSSAGVQKPSSGGPQAKKYLLRGKVIEVDSKNGGLVVDHQAIPGFMGAMTMEYKVKDPNVLTELHPGDHITATLSAAGDENIELDEIVITAQAKPDYKPEKQYHVPQAGDGVPDFKLLNQSGQTIDLNQFGGKVLLVTFIYTRCPLSDYCPRMSRNFAEIDKALESDPKLRASTHLLSISFDPSYDTPAVLRSYGGAYTGRYTKETFTHWDFAAPLPKDLNAVEEWFNVGVTPAKDGTLTHSLSTCVIGRDGKVVAWYPTNDWTTAEVMDAVKKAVAG